MAMDRASSSVETPSPQSTPEASLTLSNIEGEFSDVTIVLSDDSDDNLPKPKKTKITDYFKGSSKSICSYFQRSSQQNSPPMPARPERNSSTTAEETPTTEPSSTMSSKPRKTVYTMYTFRQKLEVLDFIKLHSESEASRHFNIPRTTLCSWKGLDSLPKEKGKLSKKGQHVKKDHSHTALQLKRIMCSGFLSQGICICPSHEK